LIGHTLQSWYHDNAMRLGAGSLVVILVWVYYSAQVFFLGTELTHVYATTYGSRAGEWDARRSDADTPGSAPRPLSRSGS